SGDEGRRLLAGSGPREPREVPQLGRRKGQVRAAGDGRPRAPVLHRGERRLRRVAGTAPAGSQRPLRHGRERHPGDPRRARHADLREPGGAREERLHAATGLPVDPRLHGGPSESAGADRARSEPQGVPGRLPDDDASEPPVHAGRRSVRRGIRSRAVIGLAALGLLGAAAAPGGSPALADSSQQQKDEVAALVKAACGIPRTQLVRMWRGTRPDWGGYLLMLPEFPDFVSGGISHAGPWNYLQEVPMFWYGPPFIKPGVVKRPVISTDIAPTEGALLNYQFHAPDGQPLPEIFPAQRPNNVPRLLVTLV